jgi:hypothetical protein
MGQLDDVTRAAPPGGWFTDVPKLFSLRSKHQLSGGESKTVEKTFAQAVAAGDPDSACRIAAIGLGIDESRFLPALRRRGYLRPSKYDFQTATIESVTSTLIDSGLAAALGPPGSDYLTSLRALYRVAGEVRKIRDRLIGAIDSGRERTLKGLLATVDLYFMGAAWRGVVFGDRSRPSGDDNFFSAEEYAEAFSYAFALHHERWGEWRGNPTLEIEAVVGRECFELLVAAAHIRAFHEFETVVDVYGYTLRECGAGSFSLEPPSPEFERSLRLGFIQTQWQSLAGGVEYSDPDSATLRGVGEKLYDAAKGAYVELRTTPVERYCFGFPDDPDLRALLASEDDFFGEEVVHLNSACRSLMAEPPELLAFEVAPGVTLKHLVKTQRVFAVLRWYAAHHLMPILMKDKGRAGVVLQSLVPHMTPGQLRSLLGIVMDSGAADSVIDMLTWNPGRDKMFDVQYQPLVNSGEGRLVPVNLLSGSSLLRNALMLRQVRLYEDGTADPVSALLAETLRRYTPHTATGTKYNYQGVEGELDMVALLGDLLFVNECKHPLLPTGPHEMRNSWEYIEKAVRQLDTLTRLFADPGFRTHLEGRLGFSLGGVRRVATCIVMSNRMFTGYRAGAHPVRGLYELVHFLSEGTTQIGNESAAFWAGPEFAPKDLVRYLDDDIVHRPQFEAMSPYDLVYQFGGATVRYASFKLDMDRLAERLGLPIAAREIAEARRSSGGFIH